MFCYGTPLSPTHEPTVWDQKTFFVFFIFLRDSFEYGYITFWYVNEVEKTESNQNEGEKRNFQYQSELLEDIITVKDRRKRKEAKKKLK